MKGMPEGVENFSQGKKKTNKKEVER